MSGGTADVWRVTDDRKRLYAGKVFRVNYGEDYKIKVSFPPVGRTLPAHVGRKRFYKEVTVWKRLNHPNLVFTLGVSPDIADFCAVSPWMPDGDLLQYLAKYPGANRVAIVIANDFRTSDCG